MKQPHSRLQDRIDAADRLVKEGRLDEARSELADVCRLAPDDDELLSDVVSILMRAELYDEAEKVHTTFRGRTGRQLRADFNLESVRSKRAEAQIPKLTFRRLTIRERGHLPNRLRLWPVRMVAIAEDALTLRTAGDTVRFPWPALSATIEERRAFKSYGRAAGAHYVRRTLILSVSNRTFRIDVSDQFPDLESTSQFLGELSKRVTVRVLKK